MGALTGAAEVRRKTPWRDNAEALVVAIVMAVFLKYFIVEAYKIPTGSMQPTLMGQAFGQGGGVFDRILVDKLSFQLRDPERWEIVVFKYPLDRAKNFVKRLWGLPGEELRISRGDVWVRPSGSGEDWKTLRRPRAVQEETLRPLDLGAHDEQPSWNVELGEWRALDRGLEARGSGRALFVGHGGGSIVDRYLDGYPHQIRDRISPRDGSGRNEVGDLRLAGRVRALPGLERVWVELREGPRRYRFELPGPGASGDATPRILTGPEEARPEGGQREAQAGSYRLAAGRWTDFAVQNLDDLLRLEIGGEVVASLEVAPASDQSSAVRIELEGEGADLDRLQVWRDIYYLDGSNGSSWTIPDGHYFMLGDNTQDSSDGREWKFFNVALDGGDGSVERMRGNSRRHAPGSSPLDSNPFRQNTLDGRLTWFRDEWGEPHVFPSERETPLSVSETLTASSFVPRELITGRAVMIFWPVSPSLRLWRLRWVH